MAMTWLRVCDVAEFDDSAVGGQHAGREYVVQGNVLAIFKQNDAYFAIDGMCAHQGGPLAQGELDGECLTCPWHGWQYGISDGCNRLTGKPMLTTYRIEQRGSELFVQVPQP